MGMLTAKSRENSGCCEAIFYMLQFRLALPAALGLLDGKIGWPQKRPPQMHALCRRHLLECPVASFRRAPPPVHDPSHFPGQPVSTA